MYNVSLPWWAWRADGRGTGAAFWRFWPLSVKRNHGVKRSLFASPYILWMILFHACLPCVLIAYYAFDRRAAASLDAG